MRLSKASLKNSFSGSLVEPPGECLFSLPEKVLQFGTGVLLRGLIDYFIDKANRKGLFNGRVVMVKSTSLGSIDEFEQQDNLYTLCVRGIENNSKTEEFIINSSISRVLSANENWNEVLRCAHNPELTIIVSNTTEVGIALTRDDITASPPASFPGKLLSILHERYLAFAGDKNKGFIIIPAELIPDNGATLRAVILELAKLNGMQVEFIQWIQDANHFCNSLVDRIVPGKLNERERGAIEKKLDYEDELMILAEPFRLWAIETGDERVQQALSFSGADDGLVIAPDIEQFRELKLRLLNGTHTFSCGLAFLAGFKTVKEGMGDPDMAAFVQNLALGEIAVAMSDAKIPYATASDYAYKVLERFRNPFIDHAWINITLQYSTKMKMRNIPLLVWHYQKSGDVPPYMALGFAAFLLFMKCEKTELGFAGNSNGATYIVQDNAAAYFSEHWKKGGPSMVDLILADKEFWGTDLSSLPGFSEAVKKNLDTLIHEGAMTVLRGMIVTK